MRNSSSPEEDWLVNLLLWRWRGWLLLVFVTRARSYIQTGIPLECVAFFQMVINAAQSSFAGGAGGRVVIVGDSDLFILLSLQLALVESERPFKNVFDLCDKQKRHASL